jgi:polyvinyl alcohol dehydrogenase (cytochrome)
MFNFRFAEAAVSAMLLLALPSFSQTPNGWPFAGNDLNNSRWASAETILSNQNVSSLTVLWQFTTQNDVSATPSVDATGGYVYFPDWSGNLYKLNAATGASVWTHKMTDYGLSSAVMSRTTPTLYGTMVLIGASAPIASPNPSGSYLLALNASDGSLIWSTALDPDLNSVSTASPIIYNGIAYVGVSSCEEKLDNPTFRGSLVAVSLANGQILWQTYFVPTGYTGAPVWSSTPVIDVTRSQIYVTTGNNYLVPPSVQACEQAASGSQAILACQASNNYEDSVVALDLATGNVKWGRRCSADDAWITACSDDGTACPDPAGNDLDFGAGANLFTVNINGVPTQLVGAGQKSGFYWALSPTNGAIQWTTSVGPSGKLGGMEWGTASDNQRIYVALSNSSQRSYTLQPSGVSWNGASWAALNPATGAILWQVPDPGFSTVHPGVHALALGPVTVANGVVYAASMSGYMYALNATTGATLWSFQAPGSVNASPAVVNGTLYWGTGYHNFPAGAPVGTASNTFYAFALPVTTPPVVTLACAASAGQVGALYSSSLTATGGVPPYTFSITGGSLPQGLMLNSSTGAISGTPTVPGSFSYTIQVADSTGTPAGTATSNCGIAIAPAPVTLACAAGAGQVGAPYSSSLTATGGVPPYTFSFTAGALPLGLALNSSTGAISGTPTLGGSFPFTTQVADSTGTPAGTTTSNCGIAIATLATSTALAVAPNPAGLGQPVTLTAQISPAPGAGQVTFYDGTAALGLVAVAGGSASLTTSLLTAAAHTLRAYYGGNPSYTSSTSAATALTVQALPSSTLLPAVPYVANGPGTWVAVGDFNGDGKADFVVANSGVSVWLGNGDGTFQAPVSSASGASPMALATGDFNGDGLLDVAAVYATGSVAILLGNGDGTFQAAVNYAAGSSPAAVAVADFNGDGVPDLGVANAGGVSVLLGNGDGTFQAAVNYAAGSGPAAVAVGDFIGNGKADLAVVNAADGTVSVLLGNGDGTFQAAVSYAVGANPQGVALGDLNGDGRPDMVVANNAANSVSVLLGNGDGTFQAAVSYAAGANPQAVAVEDVNGDGQADVVAAIAGAGNVSVLLGNGNGTLQAAVNFGAGSGPVSLALADFNGDGRADVVATGGSGNTAEVLLGGQAATSVALSAAPNPSTAGQPVTWTGSVTPAGPFFGLPTGTLTFSDNGTALPGGTVALSGGAAGYTSSSLAVGTHPITSAYSGDAAFLAGASAALTETVSPAAQTIAFGSIPNQTYGSAPFPVSATASSGLAVSFASTTAAACTVSGAIVTLVAVGTCTIQATQPGNTIWAAATPVNQSFQVAQESQTITFGALSSHAFGTAPFTVSATASSGLAVSFTSTAAVCTLSGATVTLVAVGNCTIQATQPGNTDYAAATAVSRTFQVTRGSQTIIFGVLSNRAFGSAPFAVSATASSGLTVSFNSQTTTVCRVSGTTVTLVAAGTCTIQATQAGNTNWIPATPVSQSFQVTQESQTITFGALSNHAFGTAPFTVSATASSGLAVSFASTTAAVCTVSGATVTLVAVGACTIQATQAGNTNYAAAAPVNRSFQVTRGSQTIIFGVLSNQVLGSPPFTVSATASSGLTVSFNSQTTKVCHVSGTTVTMVAVGTCTIQATQAGNANWIAATPVNQSFQVTQGS